MLTHRCICNLRRPNGAYTRALAVPSSVTLDTVSIVWKADLLRSKHRQTIKVEPTLRTACRCKHTRSTIQGVSCLTNSCAWRQQSRTLSADCYGDNGASLVYRLQGSLAQVHRLYHSGIPVRISRLMQRRGHVTDSLTLS